MGLLKSFLGSAHLTNTTNFSLCGGIAGIAWLIDFLNQIQLLNTSSTEVFYDQFDNDLKSVVKNQLYSKFYDYLHGPLGICSYLLQKDNDIDELISIFMGMGIEDNNTLKWKYSFKISEITKYGFHFRTGWPATYIFYYYSILNRIKKNIE